MDKKVIIGIAVAGAALVGGITVGVVKIVKTAKSAKKNGMTFKDYTSHMKDLRKQKAKKADPVNATGVSAA
jgi:hypothetical protein